MSSEENEFGLKRPALNHQWKIEFNNGDDFFKILTTQIISLKIEQQDFNTVECECVFEADADLEVNTVLYEVTSGRVRLEDAKLAMTNTIYPDEIWRDSPRVHNRPIQLTDIRSVETTPLSMNLNYCESKQIHIPLTFTATVTW